MFCSKIIFDTHFSNMDEKSFTKNVLITLWSRFVKFVLFEECPFTRYNKRYFSNFAIYSYSQKFLFIKIVNWIVLSIALLSKLRKRILLKIRNLSPPLIFQKSIKKGRCNSCPCHYCMAINLLPHLHQYNNAHWTLHYTLREVTLHD